MTFKQYLNYCKTISLMRELHEDGYKPEKIDWLAVAVFLFCCGVVVAWVLLLQWLWVPV